MVGQHVELLLLDMRRGYLGRGQSKWLKSRLGSSTATWKVVLSGSSFGRIDIDDKMVSQLTVDNQSKCNSYATSVLTDYPCHCR